eukprot:gene14206-30226_t
MALNYHVPEKRHHETMSHILPAAVINKQLVKDEREGSLILGEGGKVHFSTGYCKEEEFLSTKKKIPFMVHSGDGIVRGTRIYSQEVTDPILHPKSGEIRNHLRVFPEERNRRSDYVSFPAHWKSKAQVKLPNGMKAADLRSDGYDLEPILNRKQRVKSLDDLRNNIPLAKLGDKAYSVPEQSPNFFVSEGLIAGSTNTYRNNKTKNNNSNLEVEMTLNGFEKHKMKNLYKQRNYDMNQENDTILGQKVPSWEEKTGLYLVSPADEDD